MEELEKKRSDGCTGVPDVARHCCVLHDLRYRGIIEDVPSRAEADRRFRECLREMGKEDEPLWRFLFWEPLAWTYWAGSRLFGWVFWRRRSPFRRISDEHERGSKDSA